MAAAVAVWGLGFAATNSMQQVRLVAADPSLAGATVSLNTSVLYIGQAIGSAIGGALFAAGLLHVNGFVSLAFMVTAVLTVAVATREGADGRCAIARLCRATSGVRTEPLPPCRVR